MKYLLYYILIGISCLAACTSTPDSHFPRYAHFAKTQALSAQVIDLDTILFRYPFRVAVKDSIVIVMDLHNADHYLHAFTYPEWKHIASFSVQQYSLDHAIYGIDVNEERSIIVATEVRNDDLINGSLLPTSQKMYKQTPETPERRCMMVI